MKHTALFTALKAILLFGFFSQVLFFGNLHAQIITTIAGNGTAGYTGDAGAATAAELFGPRGVAYDNSGNVYFTDAINQRIRKINTSGIISTIAGNGTAGYLGYGGAATAAELHGPYGVAVDNSGNVYIADYINQRIRKINTSGIITTIAGNGTAGYTGDGGAATAAELDYPTGVAVDNSGNVYIADSNNNRIRKINTSGIISTIAGNGTAAYSGDGGASTAAELFYPTGVAVDNSGNVYIADMYNNRIRKINTSGIISTIAGNGTAGYSGDGGASTAAELYGPTGVAVDNSGNVYIADLGNLRIRKINTSGIISTIAGNGTAGYSGDGGASTAAELYDPTGVAVDNSGNVYIADYSNNRIRMILISYLDAEHVADSFGVNVNPMCSGAVLNVITKSYNPSYSVKCLYGDGQKDTVSITNTYSGEGYASLTHVYAMPGNYTIKALLYNGASPFDSISFTYQYKLCNTLTNQFYFDANHNCLFDSGDWLMPKPVLTEVDSNGIAIDTISSTGGLYYTAYGNPGDIYQFKIISSPGAVHPACPATGIIRDSLQNSAYNINLGSVGFQCGASSSFDLEEQMGTHTGRHMQSLDISVANTYCTPETATLTLNFSPKYVFGNSLPAPTSLSGSTATWNLGALSYGNLPQNIHVTLNVPGAWLIPGDTVMTNCVITPMIGDTDTVNNVIVITDTVKGSWDPNEMSVSPGNYITDTTLLTYTVQFENTGNDTAHNIYVMDTLSDFLNPSSLRMIMASNTMNIAKFYDSIHHWIYKFEFPGINLLDSSHHNQCDGMFIYTIKPRHGLAAGTQIPNHAGIFFDDNAVVMTDTTVSVIGYPVAIKNLEMPAKASVYPNPANNKLYLQSTGYDRIEIANMMNQTVLHQTLKSGTTVVDIAALPSGVYFVAFFGETGKEVKKVVKW